MERKLHVDGYNEWKEHAADEYIQAQKNAFLDGFETAAKESREFNLLRQWLEQQRDEAHENSQEAKENDDTAMISAYYAERMAYIEVLKKLHEIGSFPDEESDTSDHSDDQT